MTRLIRTGLHRPHTNRAVWILALASAAWLVPLTLAALFFGWSP